MDAVIGGIERGSSSKGVDVTSAAPESFAENVDIT
jgi:hypothetical protein